MREQEVKEIRALIGKTESCLSIIKNRIDDYRLDNFSSTETKNFKEEMYGLSKKIDWSIVRARRAYKYSWRKIANEVGVSHTTLIDRARRLGMTINLYERDGRR